MTPSHRLQAIVWITIGAAFLWLLYLLSPILAPFLLAAILAYICNPLAEQLEKWRLPRTAAVALVLTLLAAALVLLILILVPVIQKEGAQLSHRLPTAIALLNDKLAPWLTQQFGINIQFDIASLRALLTENWDTAQGLATHLFQSLKIGGLALAGLIANLLLAPVVMFYLMRDWNTLITRLNDMIPRKWHTKTLSLCKEVDAVLAEFLRGQLLVMLVLAIYYSLGLWIAGLEFALPVGILTGLLIFIPYIGFTAGFILALLAALLQFQGAGIIIGVLVVYGLGQALESFLLTPFLVGERIGLHPLAVIFSLMAFGQLFGFFGVLLALPVSAVLLVGLREMRSLYLNSHLYQGS